MSAGMDPRHAQRIEETASLAAAVILAAAVAFAVGHLTPSPAVAGSAAAVALFIALLALRSVAPGDRGFSLAQFTPAELAFEELDELQLTEADRAGASAGDDELVLDDILASLGEDSRVVRLFDASAMPTPGQLRARVDRHLGQTRGPGEVPDASAALHDALAELRQSLR
jgi:hypothetical protein